MYANKSNNNLIEKIRGLLFASNPSETSPMTEQELGKRFDLSRTPVRDALKVLENEGLIERRKRKGIYLKALSISEVLALYDVRSVLEGFAGRLAAGRAKVKDLNWDFPYTIIHLSSATPLSLFSNRISN